MQLTDPAKELAELCRKLSDNTGQRGDDYLAAKFGVVAWSEEFYQIIFCIIERANFLEKIVKSLDADEDLIQQTINNIENIKLAFNRESLANRWDHNGLKRLSESDVGPVRTLSISIRPQYAYPQFNAEELAEIIEHVNILESWLNEHQLVEQDFIRQAIIVGIRQFRFRLERIGWVGWAYTVNSLKEVIGAYFALEHKQSFNSSPDTEAMLKKVKSAVETIYEKIKITKELVETGDFLLRIYGAAQLTMLSATKIAGLIEHSK